MKWTINNVEFSASGLTNVTRERFNMATDRLTFEAAGRAIDADLLFAYDQVVTIKRDNVPFFSGRAGRTPVSGTPVSEGHAYEVLGPWDQLERLTFMQPWKSGRWKDDVWIEEQSYRSRCILGQSETGDSIPLGKVITSVVEYARECGVLISVGSIDDGPFVPWEEVRDLSCADVIRRMARWVPGSVGYFDYSLVIPSFNFVPLTKASPVTIDISSLSNVTLTQIGSRSVPAVVLIYERTDTVDGQSMSAQAIDAYPVAATGREIGAVVQTIGLSGFSATVQKQKIFCRDIPEMTPSGIMGWFLVRHPEWSHSVILGAFNPKFKNVRITSVSRKYPALPFELLEGSLQDWMRDTIQGEYNHDATYRKHDEQDVVSVTISYEQVNDAGKVIRSVKDEVVTTTITATDCASGTYERSTVDQVGEEIPPGLAQYLYTVLNATHYQGSMSLVMEEITGVVGLGNRVLISRGPAAWLSMSAVVQSVSEKLDTGETQINVGPPSHLTTSDILELKRANRVRVDVVGGGSRISGLPSPPAIILSSATPKGHGGSSPGTWGVHIEKVITAVRFDSASNCLQVKTREVAVQHAEDESDWTTIDGGQAEDCDDGAY